MRGRWVCAAIVVFGIGLRLAGYLDGRALWLDEAALALYVQSRPVTAFVSEPTDAIPGVPPRTPPLGFLMVERIVAVALGTSEYALRLLPLACGIGALALLLPVARWLVPAAVVPWALLLFAGARRPVFYATELKPYAGDALATVVALGFLQTLRGELGWRRCALHAFLGMGLVLLSRPSVFVLASVALCLLVVAVREGQAARLGRIALVTGTWALAAGAHALVSLRSVRRTDFLHRFWAEGFAPLPPTSWDDVGWYVAVPWRLVKDGLGYVPPELGVPLLLVGAWSLARSSPRVVVVAATSLAFAIVASALRAYPFAQRLLLFMAPLLALVLGAGVAAVHAMVRPHSPVLALGLGALLIVPTLRRGIERAIEPPRPPVTTRALLAHVRAEWQPGDRILVAPRRRAETLYYAPRYGIEPGDMVMPRSRRHWLEVTKEIQPGRLWAIYPTSHFQDRRDRAATLAAGNTVHSELVGRGRTVERHGGDQTDVVLYELDHRPTSPSRERAQHNVLLISIDSLRADHLGAYGYERDTSPAIDRLAREGVLFETVVAETTWTLPTHATMLTGLTQGAHGVVRGRARLGANVLTLAEALGRAGYQRYGVWSGPYLHDAFGFAQGFEAGAYEGVLGATCLDDRASDQSGRQACIEAAHADAHKAVTSPLLVGKAIDFLDRMGDAPFFLFVHFFDVHYDYIPPERYWRLFDPNYAGDLDVESFDANRAIRKTMPRRDLEHLIARYDGEIRFVDDWVGTLLEALETRGLADDTLIVLTSDHGDEFFEHGHKGHRKNLFDETVLVPMVMRLPGVLPAGRRVTAQVRHLDVMPTILDLVGLDVPDDVMGLSVAAAARGGTLATLPAVSRLSAKEEGERVEMTSVRFGHGKVVWTRRGDSGDVEAFDLRLDPAERFPLPADAPIVDEAAAHLAEVERIETTIRGAIDPAGAAAPPPELTEALRALGYVE